MHVVHHSSRAKFGRNLWTFFMLQQKTFGLLVCGHSVVVLFTHVFCAVWRTSYIHVSYRLTLCILFSLLSWCIVNCVASVYVYTFMLLIIYVADMQDPRLEQNMMNGHLLACATFGNVIASVSSVTECHSRLLQVSFIESLVSVNKMLSIVLIIVLLLYILCWYQTSYVTLSYVPTLRTYGTF